MSESTAGAFVYIIAGVPCSTRSIARHLQCSPRCGLKRKRQARPLRDRFKGGAPLPWLSAVERNTVAKHDKMTERTVNVIAQCVRARMCRRPPDSPRKRHRTGYLIENPPDRYEGEFATHWADHPFRSE